MVGELPLDGFAHESGNGVSLQLERIELSLDRNRELNRHNAVAHGALPLFRCMTHTIQCIKRYSLIQVDIYALILF